MNNQQGIGLPELLIALFLASITLLTLMRHYLHSKQQVHHIKTVLEQSIELQLVTDLIRDSSRRAGFSPCSGIEHLKTTDRRHAPKKLVAIEINLGSKPSLQINRMSEHFVSVLQILGPVDVLIAYNETLNRDHPILIADCYHAEVHEISQVRHTAAGQIITLNQSLAFRYYAPIYMGAWMEEAYFIHAKPNSKSSLFYRLHHAEELTTFVHTLSARMEKHQGKTLLQVILGLENAQQLTIETQVRTR